MVNRKNGSFGYGMVCGFALAVTAIAAMGAGRVGSSPFVSSIMNAVEGRVKKKMGRRAGVVLAKIEDRVIRKRLFERQYRLFVETLGSVNSGKLLADKTMRRRFLDGLVENEVFFRSFRKEARFQDDLSFLIFLDFKMKDSVKDYFLMNKVASSVDRKVTDSEIGKAYDRLKKEPRYAAVLARMGMSRVKKYLRNRIVQMRKIKAARKYIEKLKMRYRIEVFEKRL